MSKLINSIFLTEGVFKNTGKHQKFMYNREQLLRDSVAQELNTYLNFGVFPVPADTQRAKYLEDKGYKVRIVQDNSYPKYKITVRGIEK